MNYFSAFRVRKSYTIQKLDATSNPMALFNGKLTYDHADIFFSFLRTDGWNYNSTFSYRANKPRPGDTCVLKDAADASLKNLAKRKIAFAYTTILNYGVFREENLPADFESCTILAMDKNTSQDVKLNVKLNYCLSDPSNNSPGFDNVIAENEDFCFKLLETIEDHVQILPGAPILCGSMSYVGRVLAIFR